MWHTAPGTLVRLSQTTFVDKAHAASTTACDTFPRNLQTYRTAVVVDPRPSLTHRPYLKLCAWPVKGPSYGGKDGGGGRFHEKRVMGVSDNVSHSRVK